MKAPTWLYLSSIFPYLEVHMKPTSKQLKIKYLDYKIISTYQDIFVFWTLLFWPLRKQLSLLPMGFCRLTRSASSAKLENPTGGISSRIAKPFLRGVSSDRGNSTCPVVTPLKRKTSWWFQPLWKICSSKWESSPIFGVNIRNIWNHHPEELEPPKRLFCCLFRDMLVPDVQIQEDSAHFWVSIHQISME